MAGFLLLAGSAVLLTAGSELFAGHASAAGVAAALALLGGQVGRSGGALLVAAYLAAVAAVWWRERRPPAFGEAAELDEPETGSPAPQGDTRAAVLVAGVAAMAAGGWLAVAGAGRIAGSLGLAQSVVGLTVVALATTAELFALVRAAFRRGVEEFALAGVLGSAVYIATATLGVAALVHPLRVSGPERQAWLAAALPAALVVYAVMFQRVGRIGGGLLVAIYGAYLAVTFAAA